MNIERRLYNEFFIYFFNKLIYYLMYIMKENK